MSEKKSWNNIGEDIRNAVDRALVGDFTGFGDALADTILDTMDNVGNMVGQAVADKVYQPQRGTHSRQQTSYTQRMEQITRERKEKQEKEAEERRVANARRIRCPFVPVGKISSILYMVFGSVGAGTLGILTLIFLMLGLFVENGFLGAALGCTIGGLLSGFLIHIGVQQSSRLKRAKKYAELTGNNHYINIDELAARTNQTVKSLLRDLKKMFKKGFFPEGHLDAEETCLMLDEKIFIQYLRLQKQRHNQEIERRAQEQIEENEQRNRAAVEANQSELEKTIAEGWEYIRKLRDLNDNIPGEEISMKLFRLESLLKEIFEGLKKHPEQLPQMKKFMNYYLPTTLKLVTAYEQFDSVSEQGEDIKEAKIEIEKTLDTINDAFAELLNRLFRDTVYDVTTDAQVLQTMLGSAGLTGNKDFDKVPKN